MKITTGIASTTHVDRHGEKMSKQTLVSMAEEINKKFIPLLIEHDFNRQIGINLYAKVFQLDDGEFALGVVCGVFENSAEKEKYKARRTNTFKRGEEYLDIQKLKRVQEKNIISRKKPERYNNIAKLLETHLDTTEILPDGRVYKVKRFIAQVNDLKIEIYPKDHYPPHFHVISRSRDINARFDLITLEHLNNKAGNIKQKDVKKIQNFFITHPDFYNKLRNEHLRFN